MRRLQVLLLFGCSLVAVSGGGSTVVVPPPTGKPYAGLIMLPGASISADNYLPLGRTALYSSDYSLYIATLGGWLGNIINPLQLPHALKSIRDDMIGDGLPADAPVFIAAHSLAGVFLDEYVRSHPEGIAGIILFGSYISKSANLSTYPVPVLTIAGDQDGMCRITRIAKDLGQLTEPTTVTPVLIVPGVNHSQVASGEMPSFVKENDLIADLSYDDAHKQLAKFANAFMSANGKGLNATTVTNAKSILLNQLQYTNFSLSPFNAATAMDHMPFPDWATTQQQFVAALDADNVTLNMKGKEVSVLEILEAQVEVKKISDLSLAISVPFHNDMPLNPMDISLTQQTPKQLLTASASKERLEKYFPKSWFSNYTLGCNTTNNMTIEMAKLFLTNYIDRYQAHGRKIVVLPDQVISNKVEWLATNMKWTLKNSVYELQSPIYHDKQSGNVYCKIITLSKAMEYILIDAFKKYERMLAIYKSKLCFPGMLYQAIFLTSFLCIQQRSLVKAATDTVTPKINFKEQRESHTFKTLSSKKYARLADLSDMSVFKKQILKPMLIERVADSDGNMYTQEHIKYWMGQRLGWHIEEDSFEDKTPYNMKNFRNIIATVNPEAPRFLTLACHFDSKYFKEFEFIGATDSAVPCAMLLDLARTLNYSLHNGQDKGAEGVSLRFIFFDGEEAFVDWTETDSIYGARHLAEKWENTVHPHDEASNVLHGIDALLLLDLIGAKNPKFRDFFPETSKIFKRLQSIEAKLHKAGLLEEHINANAYFVGTNYFGRIEDDHVPFMRRDVPILHMIATPFPDVWHTVRDNESALHYPTINNLNKILRVFVCEYLHLQL